MKQLRQGEGLCPWTKLGAAPLALPCYLRTTP
jgi:hypothetical protein